MAPPRSRPEVAAMRLPLLFGVSLAVWACAHGKKAGATRHAAHGHAIATVERGESKEMLERVEDEDTQWVEIPNFGECPYAADEIPRYAPLDDSHVPGLDPERTRLTNLDTAKVSIHNEALLGQLSAATTEVLTCVSASNCYDQRPLEPGSIELNFEVAPDGDVRGVDVEPTPGLDHTGVRACARLAIWETKFPPFEGRDMVVTYHLDID